ncbi:MAG TPA: hypothetical protein VHK65_09855 [Candidatus Dormibacteraeota bacterium]|nr:hypothetical protein [Candidatus Dormibacteraeota bacterium]
MNGQHTPQTLVIVVGVFAAVGAAATLYLGADMLAVQLQPDTRRFQDLIRVGQVLVLFLVGITACVGVGAGIGGLALTTGRGRLGFGAAIAITLVGLGCAVLALR